MRTLPILAACLFAGSLSHSQSVADFFDDSTIQDLRISISAADWQTLHDHYLENTYYKCDFEWRGTVVKNAGVRSRGSGTRNPIKPGLQIDFSKYDSKQRFLGLKSFILRNFALDGSTLHERLSMLLFARMGLPYERAAHARLFVNGEYYGLFLLVEPIDSRFLKLRFGSGDGNLYEANASSTGYQFEYLGDDPSKYCPALFDPKTDNDDPPCRYLAEMTRVLNQSPDATFAADMDRYLDLGAFVSHLAVELFLAESDGIVSTSGTTNFYLYRRPEDKRGFFLVWDKEMTFTSADWPILSRVQESVLARRALAVPELRYRFLNTIHQAADIAGGEGGWLSLELEREYAQVKQAVAEDPRRVCPLNFGLGRCTLDEFQRAVDYTRGFVAVRAANVYKELKAAGWATIAGTAELDASAATNAASAEAVLAPGALARLKVQSSGGASSAATQSALPQELVGVIIDVAGVKTRPTSTSDTLVTFQVPYEVLCGPATLKLFEDGKAGEPINVEIRPAHAGIFAVTHADGRVVDASAPVTEAEYIVVWATGLGPAIPGQTTGSAPATGTLAVMKGNVTATLGGAPVSVVWAGLAPGFAGLSQVNLRIERLPEEGRTAKLVIGVDGEPGGAYELAIH